VVADLARFPFSGSGERVSRRRDGHECDVADPDALDAGDVGQAGQGPADADGRDAVEDELRDRAKGLHMEPQRNGGKLRAECRQRIDDALGRKHHVEDQMNLRLQPLEKAFYLGTKFVDAVRNRARFSKNGMSSVGQLRLACGFAVEQGDSQLRFKVSDGVADCSPSAPLRQTEGLHEGRISGSS